MKFDPSVSPPCYRSNDEIIQKDTKVRIQIVGCRVEANDMVSLFFYILLINLFFFFSCLYHETKRRVQFAIGTIKKDYLGQIRDE